jgi:hypothetical protein
MVVKNKVPTRISSPGTSILTVVSKESQENHVL